MHVKPQYNVTFLFHIVIILAVILTGCSNVMSSSPLAHQGTIDLHGLNFEKHDPVKLKGEWAFYWKQLLTPDALNMSDSSKVEYIKLPSSWIGDDIDKEELSGTGYATFRLNISIDESMVKKELALKIPKINYSYKLWIDGQFTQEVGKVGRDRKSSVPQIKNELIPFVPQDGDVELVIQVSNFHHMRGGIPEHIYLGSAEQLINKTNLDIASELFITGSIISMGIYNLLLVSQRRQDRAPLYFGVFCIVWGIRNLFVGEVILTKIFPAFPWEIELKYEYIALFIGTYIFAKYVQSMYREEMPKYISRVSGAISFLFSFVTIVTPARVYTHTLLAYEIYTVFCLIFLLVIICRAALHKRDGALLLSIVSIISFLTVINDFLYYAEKILIGNLSPLGLFIFTLAQMYILSNRFSNTYAKVEEVSEELKETNERLVELNRTLEDKVNLRTLQLAESNEFLRETNEELLQSREARSKLLSYITHDLRNPITSIIGYSEIVLDNINPDKQKTYLKYIHDKTLRLHHMIRDLNDLSLLENRNFRFHMQDVEVGPFLRMIYEKYNLVVADAGLHFYLEFANNVDTLKVRMDPDRMEQVLYNLISNSVKFTESGGTVTLFCEMYGDPECNQQSLLFKMIDTGIGIPAENLPHIFERDFKDYPSDLISKEGSGLGLAICKEIIEFHHGKIWADSIPQKGSYLCFTLPLEEFEG